MVTKEDAARLVHRGYKTVAPVVWGLLCLSPPADIISDFLTIIYYYYVGHPWWASISTLIFVLSSRFTILFFALRKRPTLQNVAFMYIPGFAMWFAVQNAGRDGDAGDVEQNMEQGVGRPNTSDQNSRTRAAEPGRPLPEAGAAPTIDVSRMENLSGSRVTRHLRTFLKQVRLSYLLELEGGQ